MIKNNIIVVITVFLCISNNSKLLLADSMQKEENFIDKNNLKNTPQPIYFSNISQELKKRLLKEKQYVLKWLEQYRSEKKIEFLYQDELIGYYINLEKDDFSSDKVSKIIGIIMKLSKDLFSAESKERERSSLLLMDIFTKFDCHIQSLTLSLLPTLSVSFVDKHIDNFIKPFIQNKYVLLNLEILPVSVNARTKYKWLYDKEINKTKKNYDMTINKNKLTVSGKQEQIGNISLKARMLYKCIMLGEKKLIPELINLYKSVKTESNLHGEPLPDAILLFNYLSKLGTRDCLIEILKRFPYNFGAPEYYSNASHRIKILKILWNHYPNDLFFIKYKNYIMSDEKLDESIGGESGVEKLYNELEIWAKDNLNYDLNMKNTDNKIKCTVLYDD